MTIPVKITSWQHYVNGKALKRVEMDKDTTLDKIDEIKAEIALNENIKKKDIYLTYMQLSK